MTYPFKTLIDTLKCKLAKHGIFSSISIPVITRKRALVFREFCYDNVKFDAGLSYFQPFLCRVIPV